MSLHLWIDPDFLKARIQALTDVVNVIDNDLEAMGEKDSVSRRIREDKMDRCLYASELTQLHHNLITANKALTDRVREVKARGLTSDQLHDAFWPNVMLPGSTKPSTVVLKDYGRVVDSAFNALMNFLIEKKPVDSKEILRKRNRLLNDKLTSLMEIRKCQFELLPSDDYGPFSLSQWTQFSLRELTRGDPAKGTCPSSPPLQDLMDEKMTERMKYTDACVLLNLKRELKAKGLATDDFNSVFDSMLCGIPLLRHNSDLIEEKMSD